MTAQPEILIAGGGLGGLACALALARKGRRVRVLEKAAQFGEIGYGIQMGPNIHRVMQALGVMDALEPKAVFPDALVMMDSVSGEEVTRIALGDAFVRRYGYRYFVIHRSDLHGTLFDACRRHEEIALEASKGLVKFAERDGGVLVTCEDGSERFGAALVGADGLWSPTRRQIVNDAPRQTGHTVYRGLVPVDAVVDRQFLDSMVMWCGRDTHLVQYRLRGGTVMNNVAVFVSPRFRRGEKAFGQPDELHEMFAPAVPRVREMLKYISLERNWVLHDRDPVTNWTAGRATLLGDAAHPTLQYLAQGACMAFEDGLVLASEVARHGDDLHAAFLAYQARRMNRTARVVLSARFFAEVCHAGGGARQLRNDLLGRRSPDDPWEADWLYRGVELD
ncbi:MAG: FAD-dependent monooxygenase [Burkholderiales bacterium]